MFRHIRLMCVLFDELRYDSYDSVMTLMSLMTAAAHASTPNKRLSNEPVHTHGHWQSAAAPSCLFACRRSCCCCCSPSPPAATVLLLPPQPAANVTAHKISHVPSQHMSNVTRRHDHTHNHAHAPSSPACRPSSAQLTSRGSFL